MNTHDVVNKSPDVPESQEAAFVPSPYIDQLTAALAAAGHPNPENWKQYLHPDAYQTNDDNIQRFLINRALHMALPQAPRSTMDERYCLVETGSMERWMELLKEKVVPTMVEFGL